MELVETSGSDRDITIMEIRDTEQRVLNYMLLSASNFDDIVAQLQETHFLFTIHKRIFRQLVLNKDLFFQDNTFTTSMDFFTSFIWNHARVKEATTKEILSQKASTDIKNDLKTMQTLYAQRAMSLLSEENNIVTVITEDKNSYTESHFLNGVVIEIVTRRIMLLPKELLFYYYEDVLNFLSGKDLESEGFEVKVAFNDNKDGVKLIHIKTDLSELQWVDNLCAWADKYGLDEKIFPRTRQQLEDLQVLLLIDKGIEEIPKEISKLEGMKILYLCNNNIKIVPDELYSMHSLTDLCLHNNQITTISEKIGNLANLTLLSISNNNIEELPKSIVQLKKMKSLQIENTQVKNIPSKFIKNTRLDQLYINDELLPDIAKYIDYVDVDTINLTASHLKESSKIIQSLNLKIDDSVWMEEKDIRDKGCVLLKKDRLAAVVEIAKKLMEEKLQRG